MRNAIFLIILEMLIIQFEFCIIDALFQKIASPYRFNIIILDMNSLTPIFI